jgi:hypothetical protein
MVTYSLAGSDSSDITLSVGSQAASGKLSPTQSWDNFKTAKLGTLDLPDKGDVQVAMNSSMKPGQHIINLRAIELSPAAR